MNKALLPLNLQLFAEPEPPAAPPAESPADPTLDDLLKGNKDHQAEFDRRISKALDTAKAKWEQEAESKIAAAKTEAEKLAKMNAEQKAQHEREQREKELSDREAALTLRELKAEAAGTLTEKGLPLELLDSLSYQDADQCKASIEAVEKVWRKAVQTGVEERLKSSPPKVGNATIPTEPEKMTYSERAALFQRDRQTYENAFGRS